MRTVRILIDGTEHEMQRAFRAVHILAAGERDGTYRIIEERDGLLGRQFHPDEWVTPSPGDGFVCVPYAIGPGGDDDHRVQLIGAAWATEHGDEEAWEKLEESERSRA